MIEEVRPRSAIDPDSIARIRSASFPIARRGYDTREVERFLDKLATWLETGGADEVRAEMIRRDLARAGATTDAILREAEEKAARLVEHAQRRVESILAQVEAAKPVSQPEPAGETATPLRAVATASQIDLNVADAADLVALGLSKTQARRIISLRERRGGFVSFDELDEVPGIPSALLSKVKAGLVVAAVEPPLAA